MAASGLAQAQTINWPPAAELRYQLKAQLHGFPLKGEAVLRWHWNLDTATNSEPGTPAGNTTPALTKGVYRIRSETKVALLGTLLQAESQGRIDHAGLHPTQFTEKRLNKAEVRTQFDDANGVIHFGDGIADTSLTQGAQDRTSVTWQLAGLARHAKETWQTGKEILIPVSSRRDVETWHFKVLGMEVLPTVLGELPSLHVSKIAVNNDNADANAASSREQQIDLWFAPGLECYPVKISFTDADGSHVEQIITQISRIANPPGKP